MKNTYRLAALALALSLVPLSPAVAKSRRAAAAKPAAVAPGGVTEIELVSELPAGSREALQALVTRFNEQDKSVHVTLAERDWKSGALPHLLILDEVSERQFVATGRYKPVAQVMREAGEKFDAAKGPSAVVFPRAGDKKGGLGGLPVGLSTPVLLVNEKLYRKAGLDPAQLPKTWGQLQRAAASLLGAGVACPAATVRPATVLLQNTLAWQNEPFVATNGGLAINGLMPVRHLALMSSWVQAGLLRVYGHGDEAVEHFAKGECGMLLAGQFAMPQAAKNGVGVVVGELPYYDDMPGGPQNTLADGPALWVAAGKSAAENKASARFMSFWLQPAQQTEWTRTAGYLPLTRAGGLAADGGAAGGDLQHIQVAIKQLTAKPTTANSRASLPGHDAALRAMLDTQLDAVWHDAKAPKLALDEAVAQTRGKGKR